MWKTNETISIHTIPSLRIKHLQLSFFWWPWNFQSQPGPDEGQCRALDSYPYFVLRHWSCYGYHCKASFSQCREHHVAFPNIFSLNRDFVSNKKQDEARVFQHGVSENGVVRYIQMALGIGNMMINRRFIGYPVFGHTRMVQTESDWLLRFLLRVNSRWPRSSLCMRRWWNFAACTCMSLLELKMGLPHGQMMID